MSFNLSEHVKESLLKAASEVNTFVVMPVAQITPDIDKYRQYIIPHITSKEIATYGIKLAKSRLIAVEYDDSILENFTAFREQVRTFTKALTIIRVPAVSNVENIVADLTQKGAEIIQIVADYCGRAQKESSANSDSLLKDIIQAFHLRLVKDRIRDRVTLIASGGIGMAEHVPKAMLCGVDLTAIDIPLMVALGVRVYEKPEKLMVFPEGLDKIQPSILFDEWSTSWEPGILRYWK